MAKAQPKHQRRVVHPRSKAAAEPAAKPAGLAEIYRKAVVLSVLHAVRLLTMGGYGESGIPPVRAAVGRRRLVNFLRGNQLPPPSHCAGAGPKQVNLAAEDAFGLLEAHRGEWVEALVDQLVEAGYLALEPRLRGLPPGIALSPAGIGALAEERAEFPPSALPPSNRLGAHPEIEEKLRSVRWNLAKAERRAPYGIFPNAILGAIARRRPSSLAELAEIPGMGEARIRKYGRKILTAIRT